jgi:hypothetical protein
MNMGVGYLISGDDETDTLRRKCCLLSFRNVMGYRKEMLRKVWLKVNPMVDFSNRDNEGMAV